MSRLLSTALAILMFSSILMPFTVNAAAITGDGIVTIEQKNVEYQGVKRLGKWGLATPVAVIEGESEYIDLKKKPMGNYVLTVTPPAGAKSAIEVYQDGSLVETFTDQRTAKGKIVSLDGTLKFVITYDFILTGNVSVTSKPTGIDFELKAPAGVTLKEK